MHEGAVTEFALNFGQYREIAQRETVAVTSHGRATGYFISAVEFEELQRLAAIAGRSRAITDMTHEEIGQMATGRMGPKHTHLNALLDENQAVSAWRWQNDASVLSFRIPTCDTTNIDEDGMKAAKTGLV